MSIYSMFDPCLEPFWCVSMYILRSTVNQHATVPNLALHHANAFHVSYTFCILCFLNLSFRLACFEQIDEIAQFGTQVWDFEDYFINIRLASITVQTVVLFSGCRGGFTSISRGSFWAETVQRRKMECVQSNMLKQCVGVGVNVCCKRFWNTVVKLVLTWFLARWQERSSPGKTSRSQGELGQGIGARIETVELWCSPSDSAIPKQFALVFLQTN